MLFTSCSYIENYIKERESEGIVVSIGDQKLYKEDLENIVPQGTNSEDSVLIIDAYIRRWATNILILQNAERNLSNQEEIDKMVEEYKQRLVIHYYQQEMVNERVKTPTNADIENFYNENKNLFLLKNDIIKGAIIKVPNNIKTDKIEKKFKDIDKNIAEIEKYALQYAKEYELFTENWRETKDVIDIKTSKLKINKPGIYEEKDSLYLTLINVTDFIGQGEIAPLEMIREDVSTTLHNKHKMEYLNNFGNDIYDYAIKHNQIKIHTTNN